MTPVGWLALAGACGVLALPRPASARAGALAGHGRLAGRATLVRPRRRGDPVSGPIARRYAAIGALTVTVLVGYGCGPAVGVGAAALATAAALTTLDVLAARRAARRQRERLTALRLIGGELRAGAWPADALAAAAALGADAAELVAGVGVSPADGPAADTDPTGRALAVAWSLAVTSGAALAEVVERVVADNVALDVRRRAVAEAVAGPRASAVMVSALPAVGLALGVAMGARPLDFLLADPAGQVVCGAGLLLDAAGVLWVRRIVGRVQR